MQTYIPGYQLHNPELHAFRIGQQIAMGQHRPLGGTSGTRGVDNGEELIPFDPPPPPPSPFGDALAPLFEGSQRRVPLPLLKNRGRFSSRYDETALRLWTEFCGADHPLPPQLSGNPHFRIYPV